MDITIEGQQAGSRALRSRLVMFADLPGFKVCLVWFGLDWCGCVCLTKTLRAGQSRRHHTQAFGAYRGDGGGVGPPEEVRSKGCQITVFFLLFRYSQSPVPLVQ